MFSPKDVTEELSSFSIRTTYSATAGLSTSKGSKSSFVWKYFGDLILEKDGKRRVVCSEKVFCKLCLQKQQLAATNNEDPDDPGPDPSKKTFGSYCQDIKHYSKSVSTSNLATHLRSAHEIEDRESTSSTENRLDLFFRKKTSTVHNKSDDKRKWILARDLTIWLCRSLLPFDLVEDEGTNDFMKKYSIIPENGKLPVRTTVSRKALDDVYEAMFKYVEDKTKESPFGCITCDIWTDKYKKNAYITFTFHCISDDFELKRFALQTTVFNDKKTASRVAHELSNVLERFGLLNKDIIIVTDAGSNMVAAVRQLGVRHHLCIGHGIHNLVSTDGVKKSPILQAFCTKAREACRAVRYRLPELERESAQAANVEWMENLANAGQVLDVDEMDPIADPDSEDVMESDMLANFSSELPNSGQDEMAASPLVQIHQHRSISVKLPVPTRWHTLLLMLESMGPNKNAINTVLGNIDRVDLRFTPIEWNFGQNLVQFLNNFRRIVEILSTSKECSINLALLLRAQVEEVLTDRDDDAVVIMHAKSAMREKMQHRFPVTDLTVATAILDPRSIDLPSIDTFVKENGFRTREDFLSSFVKRSLKPSEVTPTASAEKSGSASQSKSPSTEHDVPPSQPVPAASNKCASTTASEIMNLSKRFSTNDRAATTSIHEECEAYIRSANREQVVGGDILGYWRSRRSHYPWLATLVRKTFCTQATSTESEREFSVAGQVLTAKRCQLDPARVDKIMFIHGNYDGCKSAVV